MAYQSSKRNYTSKRERYNKSVRNVKVTFLFIFLALIVWVYKNRYEFWPEMNTWF